MSDPLDRRKAAIENAMILKSENPEVAAHVTALEDEIKRLRSAAMEHGRVLDWIERHGLMWLCQMKRLEVFNASETISVISGEPSFIDAVKEAIKREGR